MKATFLILAVASGLSFTACTAQPSVAAEDRSNIKTVVKDPETALVDVRIPSEFQAGTAHRATNIPLAEIENNLDFFRQQKKVVVFCNRGRQANEAIEILKKNGITNVETGITWKNVKAIQEEK